MAKEGEGDPLLSGDLYKREWHGDVFFLRYIKRQEKKKRALQGEQDKKKPSSLRLIRGKGKRRVWELV